MLKGRFLQLPLLGLTAYLEVPQQGVSLKPRTNASFWEGCLGGDPI
ncbi:unnamed protein product [Staurois parvus]|uniref:Uncharacterized protein n=1 Tax=Staurois parvus TaxID=386267 RepID=A0ABN9FXK5_9NEOB|nr:unnamed protein product [Staurois parvus]